MVDDGCSRFLIDQVRVTNKGQGIGSQWGLDLIELEMDMKRQPLRGSFGKKGDHHLHDLIM
jgi:hypothetical protein